MLENMKVGCHEPIGVYSELDNDKWKLYVMDGRSGKALYYNDSVDIAPDEVYDEHKIMQKGYQLADKILADIASGV
jgi:porphobilinogen deaminase